MGNCDSSEILIKQQWQTLPYNNSNKIVRDYCGREGEQSLITIDGFSELVDKWVQIYRYRLQAQEPIVKCYGAEYTESYYLCTNFYTFKVVTERIVHRLIDAPQLTFPECQYILREVLLGFSFLYRKVGFFDISSKMIGFTSEGEVRIWYHKNYANNVPQFIRNSISIASSSSKVNTQQSFMVSKILRIIESKCQNGFYPKKFKEQIESQLGFRQTLEIVSIIQIKHNLQIPNRIDLFHNKIPRYLLQQSELLS